MADEKQLEKIKKEAAAKAKSAALAKSNRESEQKESGQATSTNVPTIKVSFNTKTSRIENDVKVIDGEEKANVIAKTAAVAKVGLTEQQKRAIDTLETTDDDKVKGITKAKAAASAKAKGIAKEKAIASAKAKGSITSVADNNKVSELKPEIPSAKQPLLDLIKKEITINLGSNFIEELYINKMSKDIPTLVVSKNNFYKVAKALKEIKTLDFDYFNFLHGTDFQTHMEVYTQLRSYKNGYDVALKTRLEREYPEMDSLTSLWVGASWPESEAYDLLGIKFIDNHDLHRIFLGENWVGYPLRKDYIPFEEEAE